MNLATVTDSIELLKTEVEKEETLLGRETKQLQEMEKNAKRAETERKRQMKNVRLTRTGSKPGHSQLTYLLYRSMLFFDILTVYPHRRMQSLPDLVSLT